MNQTCDTRECPLCGTIQYDMLATEYRRAISDDEVEMLGDSLGVSAHSLRRMTIGWAERFNAFSFPMRWPTGEPVPPVVGIRLRCPTTGRKWAVAGSRAGLFIPRPLGESDPLIVTEGPTDCAAVLDVGFEAIGRPSAFGYEDAVRIVATARDVVIVADQGEAGINGAKKLAEWIKRATKSLKVILPPWRKDLREWRRNGASRNSVMEVIEAASPWRGR